MRQEIQDNYVVTPWWQDLNIFWGLLEEHVAEGVTTIADLSVPERAHLTAAILQDADSLFAWEFIAESKGSDQFIPLLVQVLESCRDKQGAKLRRALVDTLVKNAMDYAQVFIEEGLAITCDQEESLRYGN